MKISLITFHVHYSQEVDFRELVAEYFKHYYPNAEDKGTLTLSNHRLIVATYDFEWLWSEVSSFVDSVLRSASDKGILVVCESVKF